MEKTYLLVLGIGLLVLVGVSVISITGTRFQGNPPVNANDESSSNGGGIMHASLIRGAACQQDSDCVYAENAYPIQRCVSPNCPPEDSPNQPVQGDPAYEWMDAYQDACINAGELNHLNTAGETLLVTTRTFSCTCEPIPPGPHGERTSLTGQKICTKHRIEG